MKKTFFIFPAGSTGVALLLLRASVSLSTLNLLYSGASPHWMSVAACVLLAFAVCAGVCTRTTAALSAVAALLTIVMSGTVPTIACITHVLPAIVLAMTGPGAISIDARLFGRRTLHLPH
jgi:hypothetical protein